MNEFDIYRATMLENDLQADLTVIDYKNKIAERDRLISIVDQEIELLKVKADDLKQEFETKTAQHLALLAEYMRGAKATVLKTQAKYRLPSGTLVRKFPKDKVLRNDDVLWDFVKTRAPEFIKVKESVDWENMKRCCEVINGKYELVKPDGELIPVQGVTLMKEDESFEID